MNKKLKRIKTCILFISTLCVTASFGFGELHIAQEKALKLYKEGKFEKALDVFEQLQSKDTTYNENIRYNIANCLYKLDKIDKAIEIYKEIITNFDRLHNKNFFSKVYFNLGNAYAVKSDKYKNHGNIKQQIEYLFLAKDSFKEASFLNKKDEDIQINLRIVSDKLSLRDIK